MSNKQTPTVADAEQAIARLEGKRSELLERGNELATVRASLAYAALTDGLAALQAIIANASSRKTVAAVK